MVAILEKINCKFVLFMSYVLGDKCVRALCSGQVITSVNGAIKELLENSIDSNGTCIGMRSLFINNC